MKNNIQPFIIAILALCSCSGAYNIDGSSSVTNLDGRMLYLKVFDNDNLKNLDSCDVIHGKFHFSGVLDTVKMASLFMDDENVMPLVVEKGEINIKIDNAQQLVSGSPLNEKLYKFIAEHNQLNNEMSELSHKQSQAIMDGKDMVVVTKQLNKEAAEIAAKEDKLVTDFIVNNFDNVLGPGVFMMITSAYPYPILNAWIDDIMSKATNKFKNDPYVKTYYKMAQDNEAKMNGMSYPGSMPPPPPLKR